MTTKETAAEIFRLMELCNDRQLVLLLRIARAMLREEVRA